MSTLMPEDDPAAVPATCWRWPTCESAADYDPLLAPYPGTCTWPACFTPPPTEGTPTS